jgi:uncharacterized repeat protein (TIGR02543 family)
LGGVAAKPTGWVTITATAATDPSKHASATVTVASTGGVTTYTVTFKSNGGSSVAPQTVEANGKVKQLDKNPRRASHSFAGWYSDAELTIRWDFDTPVTSDLMLYAKWTKTSTAVSGNAQGALRLYPNPVTNGELRVESELLKSGEKIEIYSLSGALVGVYEAGSTEVTVIDVSRLAPGVYVVKAGGSTMKIMNN